MATGEPGHCFQSSNFLLFLSGALNHCLQQATIQSHLNQSGFVLKGVKSFCIFTQQLGIQVAGQAVKFTEPIF